jgi:ankyrin repeat protein
LDSEEFDGKSTKKNTPMFIAAQKGYDKVMRVLAGAGANLNFKSGATLFEIACESGKLESVKLLINELGVTPKVKPDRLNRRTANSNKLRYSSEVLNFLSSIECSTDLTDTVFLNAAIDQNRLDLVEVFIQRGGDINKSASITEIDTSKLSTNDSFIIPCIKLLLEKGGNINALSAQTTSILMKAVLNKNLPIISYLLDKGGADVAITDSQGSTALLLAARAGDVSSVIMLLDHGADVNVINKNGQTALMLAVWHANYYHNNECVKVLQDYMQSLGKVFLK